MIPDPPNMPVTSFIQSPDRIGVQWNEPYNRGAELEGYRILIQDINGDYHEELTSCDGSDPALMIALYCEIPASILMGAAHNLIWGSIVYTKVVAYNPVG
jgi:hypothetical protein